MDNTKKGKYLLAAFAAASIWGFFAIPLRNLKAYPAEQILYNRVFMSFVVIWLTVFLFRKNHLKADIAKLKSTSKKERKTILYQILGATLLLTLNWYTYIYAVNNQSLKAGAFAYMICPLITAFGGFLILKEQLSKLKLIALVIAMFSIVMLASGSLSDVCWAIIIAAFYAFYLIIQRKMSGFDKLNILAVQITLTAFTVIPIYLYKGFSFPTDVAFWVTIFLIATFFTIIPLFLSLYALIGIPSSTMGIIIYINPIIAFAIAIIYYNERVSAHQLMAYSLLLFAVVIFNWQTLKEALLHPQKKGLASK